MRKIFQFLVLTFIFSSCARKYHNINPSRYTYENKMAITDEVNTSYLYDVQNKEQNKPYARKERKKGMKLIAVSIENNGEYPITLTKENFFIQTHSQKTIRIIDSELYAQTIRQFSEVFLLAYGIAGIGVIVEQSNFGGTTTTETSVTYNPIPLCIGIGNAIFAGSSNKNQKTNLIENNIFNTPILPKTTLYGLVAIDETSYPELDFKFIEN